MNSLTIEFNQITFTRGLTVGETIEGYLTVTFHQSYHITSLHVDFSSVIYTGNMAGSTAALIDDEPNEKSWSLIERIVRSTEQYPVEFPHYVTKGRITEIPPGTFRFKFAIPTTEEFHNISLLPNGIGICYEITPVCVNHENVTIRGFPQIVPLLFTNETVPSQPIHPQITKKEFKKHMIELVNEVTCAYQGDNLIGRILVTNRTKSAISKAAINFETITIDTVNKTLSRKVNLTTFIYNIPSGTSQFVYKLQVPMITPPDLHVGQMRVQNAVSLEFTENHVFKKTLMRIVSPVKIIARKGNSKNTEEYLKEIDKDIIYKDEYYNEIPYGPEPLYDKIIPNGIETIYTKDGKEIEIDHLEERNFDFVDFNSLCLPPTLSVGKVLNQQIFVDHITKTVSFNDPRPEIERLPQHVKMECNGFLTLTIEETVGIPLKTEFSVKYCNGQNNVLKETLSFPLDNQQNNVVISAKFEKRCIGYIDLDLNLIPMDIAISSWYFLTEPEGSEFGFSGMVRLQVCYSSNLLATRKILDYPAYISTFHFPHYFKTSTLQREILSRMKLLQAYNQVPFIGVSEKHCVIEFPQYDILIEKVQSFFPITVPRLKGNVKYIETKNTIEVDIARKKKQTSNGNGISNSVCLQTSYSTSLTPNPSVTSPFPSPLPSPIPGINDSAENKSPNSRTPSRTPSRPSKSPLFVQNMMEDDNSVINDIPAIRSHSSTTIMSTDTSLTPKGNQIKSSIVLERPKSVSKSPISGKQAKGSGVIMVSNATKKGVINGFPLRSSSTGYDPIQD